MPKRKKPQSSKLTAAGVEKIKPPTKAARVEYWDTLLSGFHLRVTRGGAKTYALMTRLHGKQIRVTIGDANVLSLAEARERAQDAFKKADRGEDPRQERRQVQAAPSDLVEDVVADFVKRHTRAKTKKRSAEETERNFRNHVLPRWSGRSIKAIKRQDILNLLDDIVDQGKPIAANRVLAAVRKMFDWCAGRGIIDASPVAGIETPSEENERDRVLTDDEVAALWRAWDNMGFPFGAMAKMLLITGQRRNEVANMRWSDIDMDKALWTLPRWLTKGDRSHQVPLSPLAIEILGSLPRIGANDCVFGSGRRGDKPPSGFSVAKKRADTWSGVGGWVLHDLRRTTGTNMAELGIARPIISQVFNHSEGGVTQIYDRHSYLPEKRRALDAWARKLESILRPVNGDNVVRLPIVAGE